MRPRGRGVFPSAAVTGFDTLGSWLAVREQKALLFFSLSIASSTSTLIESTRDGDDEEKSTLLGCHDSRTILAHLVARRAAAAVGLTGSGMAAVSTMCSGSRSSALCNHLFSGRHAAGGANGGGGIRRQLGGSTDRPLIRPRVFHKRAAAANSVRAAVSQPLATGLSHTLPTRVSPSAALARVRPSFFLYSRDIIFFHYFFPSISI